MTTALQTYRSLAQLAADCRRLGLTQTAELCESEHAALADAYGSLVEPSPSETARAAPWLRQYLDTLRMHRAYCERANDLGGALGFALSLSMLARVLREGAAPTATEAQGLVQRIRDRAAAAVERIRTSQSSEFQKVRFIKQLKWQETRRAELARVERAQRVVALEATKMQLEHLLGEAS